MWPFRIVVLGSSLSALGVVRNAHSDNLTPVLFDTERGIATRSSFAHVEVANEAGEDTLLSRICSLGKVEQSVLIGTSDRWLRFILKHREELETSYERILHPKNPSLSICLEKKDFLQWCAGIGIPVPHFYTFFRERGLQSLPAAPEIRFPLLMRPSSTLHAADSGRVPKAMEVKNAGELRGALMLYYSAGTDVVATESLLGHRITQFSVPAARSRNGIVSFVTEKLRPLPLNCAVGTYVRLRPDRAIEDLARYALDRLDYEGVAEVEILRSHDTGGDYMIEINARPWIQYNLATQSGHDFLRFLLDPESYDPSREIKSGKAWINFWDDFFACFSRSVGLVRKGQVGLSEYLSSILRANVRSKFNLLDPYPWIFDAWENFSRFALRRMEP